MVVIPDAFFKIPYNSKQCPGKKGVSDILKGANCQLFVYELLKYNGFSVPFVYRSNELWEDTLYTEQVNNIKPFDIVFFNKSSDPYGAHLGVFIGDNKVIHLSAIVGHPVIWSMEDFKKHAQYKCFLGTKRLKQKINHD